MSNFTLSDLCRIWKHIKDVLSVRGSHSLSPRIGYLILIFLLKEIGFLYSSFWNWICLHQKIGIKTAEIDTDTLISNCTDFFHPFVLTEIYEIREWEPLYGFLFYSHAHEDYIYTSRKKRYDCQCLQGSDIYSRAHARVLTVQWVPARMRELLKSLAGAIRFHLWIPSTKWAR
jgi:hypothetical protein